MVAGDLFVDIIMSGFTFWPKPGQEAVAKRYRREVGGGAAITACGLAKLGSRVGVLGVVGSDQGAWLIDRLRRAGIETSGVRYDLNEPTAFSVAISSPEERTFFTYVGANELFPRTLMEAATERMLAHARHVHLACAPELDTVFELIRALRGNGCYISLDVGWHEAWLEDPRALAAVREIDIYFPNENEAAKLTGATDPVLMLERFRDEGAKAVALKLGKNGAGLLWHGRISFVEPYHVAPEDTTGAGDCFDAGFLHAWLLGNGPEQCVRAAAVCGALSTLALGGVDAFPSAERLEQGLREMECAKSR